MPTRRLALLALAGALLAALAAATPSSARRDDSGKLAVFAAASLTEVFPKINPEPRYSFAGSDQLAAQIQLGAQIDVFAAASPKYPELLYQKGLVEKPIPFATNTLVLIVPKSNPARIHSVTDLAKRGVRIVIGDAISTRGMTVDQRQELRDRVHAAIVALKARVDAEGVVH